ncbi:hypothetical protein ACFL5Z_09270 [Planctomycetota bacterium]
MLSSKKTCDGRNGKVVMKKTGVRDMFLIEEGKREFDYTSRHVIRFARKDIDTAITGLSVLNKTKINKNSPTTAKMQLAHYLCSYSRYVHVNAWRFRISINRVKKTIRNELEKAEQKIRKMLESGKLAKAQKQKLSHYARNIAARKKNLLDNFCTGRPSEYEIHIRHPASSVTAKLSKVDKPA